MDKQIQEEGFFTVLNQLWWRFIGGLGLRVFAASHNRDAWMPHEADAALDVWTNGRVGFRDPRRYNKLD